MSADRIQQLLDRYYAGESSLEEERALRAYFRSGRVAPEHRAHAPLFAYWGGQRELRSPKRPLVRRLRLRWLAVAAAVALLLLAGRLALPDHQRQELTDFPVVARQPVDWGKYEITDEHEALRLLSGALRQASDGLRTGTDLTLREVHRSGEYLHPLNIR